MLFRKFHRRVCIKELQIWREDSLKELFRHGFSQCWRWNAPVSLLREESIHTGIEHLIKFEINKEIYRYIHVHKTWKSNNVNLMIYDVPKLQRIWEVTCIYLNILSHVHTYRKICFSTNDSVHSYLFHKPVEIPSYLERLDSKQLLEYRRTVLVHQLVYGTHVVYIG